MWWAGIQLASKPASAPLVAPPADSLPDSGSSNLLPGAEEVGVAEAEAPDFLDLGPRLAWGNRASIQVL